MMEEIWRTPSVVALCVVNLPGQLSSDLARRRHILPALAIRFPSCTRVSHYCLELGETEKLTSNSASRSLKYWAPVLMLNVGSAHPLDELDLSLPSHLSVVICYATSQQ